MSWRLAWSIRASSRTGSKAQMKPFLEKKMYEDWIMRMRNKNIESMNFVALFSSTSMSLVKLGLPYINLAMIHPVPRVFVRIRFHIVSLVSLVQWLYLQDLWYVRKSK